MKQKKRATRWAALILLLLLAFALRLYDLQGQSLWSDEGLTVYRSGQSLAGVLANEIVVDGVATQDASPPLYFLLLGGWRQLAGETVFALRFLGVLLALPAVPLLYFLGRTAFGQVVGVAAALLLTLSPFHVWQSQVLRNYGFLLSLNLLSVSALLRFLTLPPSAVRRRRWLLLWGAFALAGAYTHYFAFFILAFSLLVLVVAGASASARSQNGSRFLRRSWFWGGLLLAGVLLVPVVSVALSRFLAGRQIDFHPVAARTLLVHGLSAFGVGMSRSLSHPWWLYLPPALLAVAGLLLAWRRKPAATWFLLGYQFVPLGLLLLLSQVNPLYNGTRHLLIGLPPFLLFLAAAITVPYWRDGHHGSARLRWQRLALTAGALFLAGQVAWLSVQFHDPDFRRDDIEGVAQYLNQVARPDDLVILHDTLIAFTFDYYYKGVAPVLAIPRYDQHNQDEAVAALAAAGERGERIWFLTKPAPRTGFP